MRDAKGKNLGYYLSEFIFISDYINYRQRWKIGKALLLVLARWLLLVCTIFTKNIRNRLSFTKKVNGVWKIIITKPKGIISLLIMKLSNRIKRKWLYFFHWWRSIVLSRILLRHLLEAKRISIIFLKIFNRSGRISPEEDLVLLIERIKWNLLLRLIIVT